MERGNLTPPCELSSMQVAHSPPKSPTHSLHNTQLIFQEEMLQERGYSMFRHTSKGVPHPKSIKKSQHLSKPPSTPASLLAKPSLFPIFHTENADMENKHQWQQRQKAVRIIDHFKQRRQQTTEAVRKKELFTLTKLAGNHPSSSSI